MQTPLFIIGYMACGKTTFGRALALETGKQFIDLDLFIEQRFRKSINDIFAEKGEEGFRTIESAMLREVGEFEDVIISCGGGTPCFNGNMEWMNARGTTLWLEASEECITARLLVNRDKRPLMRHKTPDEVRDAVAAGLAARLPFYSAATIRFSGEELEDRSQIARTVRAFLKTI